jgi:P4 family phage/plasmid primase-like protien
VTDTLYVPTRAIRQAVAGHEAEVLDSLGFPWREGRPHIRCPYPAHEDGDPSWRWDQARCRAYCTCIEGSHSVFDVLMHIEACDFEHAKIRIAEILGRTDLIRNGERHPAISADHLLDPPPDQRDYDLVIRYLGHRLGVDPDRVPRPSTAMAGWRSLPYYDPPLKDGEQPVLVGKWPCAVFGTTDRLGRRHAHRIYVEPGGAGKAVLGANEDGSARDPKKSARVLGKEKTGGRAVLWGDPACAPRIVLVEGIETGAAVAHALRDAVQAGEVAVAAAITAGGIEAFEPWPNTARVTIAADRDEVKTGAGRRRGEHAARNFGARHHDRLKVAVALPGEPGASCDWLDVLRKDGAGAVVTGLGAAVEFVATPEEMKDTSGAAMSMGKSGGAPLGGNILDPADPLPSARLFVERQYEHDGTRTLHHHGGLFYRWTGTHYPAAEDAALRAQVYSFLEHAQRWDARRQKAVPFQPNTSKVNNVMDALKAVANLPSTVQPPAWLDGRTDPPPAEIVACQNGLLHLPTKRPVPASPALFSLNALNFDYDPDAPDPKAWLGFLDDLFGQDWQASNALQEAFGYVLTTDTQHQKVFLIVGPKRSGKGTIARVTTSLLGRANACAPTLASLGTNFGLAVLIGKPLAIISDARLGGRADQHAIAERLLSVSSEDAVTADRKFLPAWTGKLPTRFLILTNELPRIADTSGALASRFVVLRLENSFYGREDHGLTSRLLTELPGVLNWAIEGWRRLQERGHFVQPESAADAVRVMEDLSSPAAFSSPLPVARYDAAGLVTMLNGNRIVALTDGHAVVENATGGQLRHFRRLTAVAAEIALAWDGQDERH